MKRFRWASGGPGPGGAVLAGWIGLVAWFMLSVSCRAQFAFPAGRIELQPNQAGQRWAFEFENTSGREIEVDAFNFIAQVNDGLSGPKISSVDLLQGTVFQDDHLPPIDQGSTPWVAQWFVESGSPSVKVPPGRSQVATLTFDTRGLAVGFRGSFSLALNVPGFARTPSDYVFAGAPYFAGAAVGEIIIVPEVDAGWAIGALLVLFGCGKRMTRSSRPAQHPRQ